MIMRRMVLAAVAVALAAGLFFILAPRLLATAVTVNLLLPYGEWRPLQLLTRTPAQDTAAVRSPSGRTLAVRTYTPQPLLGDGPHPGLVISTPFIGGGLDDARLVNLGETFARAGFVTATFWREAEPLVVSERDVADVAAVMDYTADLAAVVDDRVSLFGISYGSGPAIAAARERGRPVPFIISLNGYADLPRVMDFISSGSFSYGGSAGTLTPHPYTADILAATLQDAGMTLAEFQRSRAFGELSATLSPARHLAKIQSRLFIIHSRDDRFIPYTESLYLRDAAGAAGMPVSLTLTDVIEHGEYRPLTAAWLRRAYLPAAYHFYAMVRNILTGDFT